jgi:hypothetical protein
MDMVKLRILVWRDNCGLSIWGVNTVTSVLVIRDRGIFDCTGKGHVLRAERDLKVLYCCF